MASKALRDINIRQTPQTEQARNDQTANNAGGYVFTVTPETRLRRFLTLGVDGGTYYVGEKTLARDNAAFLMDFARTRGTDLVAEIVAISEVGRAPKNDPALFALAAASVLSDLDGRQAAYAALPRVARTGTHLFQWAAFREQFGGWSRGSRRAVAGWYLNPDVDRVAYQVAKYRQRDGWSHRDLLRLSHPKAVEAGRKALFDWACGRDSDEVPAVVRHFQAAQAATDAAAWVRIIDAADGALSWEMLPDAALNEPTVWQALIARGVPMTALMRQLPRLTRIGLFGPGKLMTAAVVDQLTDGGRLAKARVHPINVLVAQRTYAGGVSLRGSSTWSPVPAITDALDAAFYASYGNVRKTGKRHLLALDVSGSMGSPAGGMPITCREVCAAMALATANAGDVTTIIGFTGGRNGWGRGRGRNPAQTVDPSSPVSLLNLSPRQRLDDAVRSIADLPFGTTDCALPAVWAAQHEHDFEAITIYTDNETYAGHVHPFQALSQYRAQVGHRVSQVVVGITATQFTIADPTDPDSLDVSGFDSAVPNLIADFAAGDI